MKFFLITAILMGALGLAPQCLAQHLKKVELVAFYNLENLFDTIDAPGVDDSEFTPESSKRWNSKRYWQKIDHLARVISSLGRDEDLPGPAVIGLSEVENRRVLQDLVASPRLAPLNYRIVHYDSRDVRGIDVALLYRPRYFHLTHSHAVPLSLFHAAGKPSFTRDQLVVSGRFEGEPMHFIVNHWPSRRGGEERSSPFRVAAAKLTRSLVDSLLARDKKAKVLVMGDFNDDPVDNSVTAILGASEKQSSLNGYRLFNATGLLYKQGEGTLAYRGKWNLFDQLIMTRSLFLRNQKGYRYLSTKIYKESYLLQQKGKYKGYPYRTYAGNYYLGGYSDHLPVYLLLGKSK